MPAEIERKFLVLRAPRLAPGRGTPILQAYARVGDPELRVRDEGGRLVRTEKRGKGVARQEDEREVGADEAAALFAAAGARRLAKTRHVFGGWEVDVYADAEGTTGYQLVGELPVRKRGDGTLPLPADLPGAGWEDELLPFDAMPCVVNPPAGFWATANAAPPPSRNRHSPESCRGRRRRGCGRSWPPLYGAAARPARGTDQRGWTSPAIASR